MRIILGLFFVGLPVQAAVIDTFSEGGFFWELSGSFRMRDSVELKDSDFLGVTRSVSSYYSSTLEVRESDGTFRFSANGSGQNTRGYLSLAYQFSEPANFLLGGETRLEFLFSDSFSSDTAPPGFNGTLSIFDGAGQSVRTGFRGFNGEPVLHGGPTIISFDFEEYPNFDFSGVERIVFDIGRQQAGSFFTLDEIRAVPEPSVVMLLLGPVGLFLKRKR